MKNRICFRIGNFTLEVVRKRGGIILRGGDENEEAIGGADRHDKKWQYWREKLRQARGLA